MVMGQYGNDNIVMTTWWWDQKEVGQVVVGVVEGQDGNGTGWL